MTAMTRGLGPDSLKERDSNEEGDGCCTGFNVMAMDDGNSIASTTIQTRFVNARVSRGRGLIE